MSTIKATKENPDGTIASVLLLTSLCQGHLASNKGHFSEALLATTMGEPKALASTAMSNWLPQACAEFASHSCYKWHCCMGMQATWCHSTNSLLSTAAYQPHIGPGQQVHTNSSRKTATACLLSLESVDMLQGGILFRAILASQKACLVVYLLYDLSWQENEVNLTHLDNSAKASGIITPCLVEVMLEGMVNDLNTYEDMTSCVIPESQHKTDRQVGSMLHMRDHSCACKTEHIVPLNYMENVIITNAKAMFQLPLRTAAGIARSDYYKMLLKPHSLSKTVSHRVFF